MKKIFVRIIFDYSLAILILFGILSQVYLLAGFYTLQVFRFFTLITNSLTFIFLIIQATSLLMFNNPIKNNFIKGQLISSLFLTGIISLFFYCSYINFTSILGFSFFILHVLSPILFYLEYIIFDKKGSFKNKYIYQWLTMPAIYYFYILITSFFIDSNYPIRFPYFFLDYTSLNIFVYILYIIAISLGLVILHTILIIFDRKKPIKN